MKRFSQTIEAEANGATTISHAMTSLAVGDGIMAGGKKDLDKPGRRERASNALLGFREPQNLGRSFCCFIQKRMNPLSRRHSFWSLGVSDAVPRLC
jgi:hypothetical protein